MAASAQSTSSTNTHAWVCVRTCSSTSSVSREQLAGALPLDELGADVGGGGELDVGPDPLDQRRASASRSSWAASAAGDRAEQRVAQRQVGEVEVVVAAATQHVACAGAGRGRALPGRGGSCRCPTHPRRPRGGGSRRARDRHGRAASSARPGARSARPPTALPSSSSPPVERRRRAHSGERSTRSAHVVPEQAIVVGPSRRTCGACDGSRRAWSRQAW